MKRRVFSATVSGSIVLAALGLSASLTACAHTVQPPSPGAYGSRVGALMQFSVVDRESGRELPIYSHNGEYWVAGTPGKRYAIRSRNTTGARVMAVMSVDGVNVVSGETAGVGQTGYVFGAGDNSDIAGWRKSDAQIAAFEFTSLGNSYAWRTGRPDNVGVIGVALFRERYVAPPPPPVPPIARSESFERERSSDAQRKAESPSQSSAPGALGGSAGSGASTGASASADTAANESSAKPAARQAAPAPSLGTGHGRRENSYVGRTSFERAQSTPDEVIRIRYESRDNLIAAGVIPVPPLPRPLPRGPSAFPESTAGYVPDPPARY